MRVHLASSLAFREAVAAAATSIDAPTDGRRLRLADLGSGGGLPGLPLFHWLPGLEGDLIDTMEKRTSFLRWAVAQLEIADRVSVRHARAEEHAHRSGEREGYDLVVARGFANPGITVECAAPLLRMGGELVLAGPPGGRRWRESELADLGVVPGPEHRVTIDDGEAVVQRLRRVGPIDERLPRPWRQLSKRPPLVIED